MKQIFRFASALAAAAALFAGCQKVEEQMTDEIVKAPVDLTDAIVATYSATTKVVDSENGLVWEENDSIAVAMRGHDFIPYYMVQLDEACKTAWFRTDAKADDERPFVDCNVAFSPLQEGIAIAEGSETICHTLPAVQEYNADGFLGRFFPMAAVTEHGYDTEFAFKNICGVLVLQLTGAGDEVETIILRGNNNEPLYGAAVTAVSAEEAPVIAELTIEPNEEGEVEEYGLTLDVAGKGVILGEEATKFWFVIPPTTFAEGITVEVITTDGYHDFISTDKEVVVGRSEELIMDPVFKQPKPQYPAMALVAEAEGNLVHLTWALDEKEHPSETPRNPGDDTVSIAKTILTIGEEEIEIPEGMTDTTLVLKGDSTYVFQMVNIPTDTMMYKPSAVATAEATTSYFTIADLYLACRTATEAAEDKTDVPFSAYAGRQYKGVVSADNSYGNSPFILGVMDAGATEPHHGMVLHFNRQNKFDMGSIIGRTVVITPNQETRYIREDLCLPTVDLDMETDPVVIAPVALTSSDNLKDYYGQYVSLSGLKHDSQKLRTWTEGNASDIAAQVSIFNGNYVGTFGTAVWGDEYISFKQTNGTISGVSMLNVLMPVTPDDIADFKLAMPAVACDDIAGVAAAGVTGAKATVTLTDAEDWTVTATPDGTVVTAASVSGSELTYTVAANTGEARDGSVIIAVSYGSTTVAADTVKVSQLKLDKPAPVTVNYDFGAQNNFPRNFSTSGGRSFTGNINMTAGPTIYAKATVNCYYNTSSKSLVIGQGSNSISKTSYLTIPGKDGLTIKKVTLVTSSSQGRDVTIALYSNGKEVSTQPRVVLAANKTYNINPRNVAVGADVSIMLMTNKANMQLKSIEVIYE